MSRIAIALLLLLAACSTSTGGSPSPGPGDAACRQFLDAVKCGDVDLSGQIACDSFAAYTCDLAPYFECLTPKYVCQDGAYDPALLASAGECASLLSSCAMTGAGGALALRVVSSREASALGAQRPPSKKKYVVVELTLESHAQRAVSLAAPLFSLRTGDGLEYAGDAVGTAALDDGCDPTANLAPEADVTCSVAFVVPTAAAPARLLYRAPDGTSAEASLTTEACETCGTSACVDLSSDARHCGDCGQPVGLGSCVGGKPRCSAGATVCSGVCVDLDTDPQNCGRCGARAPFASTCTGGSPECTQGTLCGGACIDTWSDANNCGSCGHVCTGAAGTCHSGACTYQASSTALNVSCSAVCGGQNKCLNATVCVTCAGKPGAYCAAFGCAQAPSGGMIDVPGGCIGPFKSLGCTCYGP